MNLQLIAMVIVAILLAIVVFGENEPDGRA